MVLGLSRRSQSTERSTVKAMLKGDNPKSPLSRPVQPGQLNCSFVGFRAAVAEKRFSETAGTQEFGKPVTIGSDVWVGGGAIICPGVTIGSRTVIGAGSVVAKDIPGGVVAAGNPCRIIREIIETDRDRKSF